MCCPLGLPVDVPGTLPSSTWATWIKENNSGNSEIDLWLDYGTNSGKGQIYAHGSILATVEFNF